MTYTPGLFHLLALFCTLGVEVGGMAIWACHAYARPWLAIFCALVTNLLIHTLFWYAQPFFTTHWPWGLYGAELLVVLLEGAIYARCLGLTAITPWLLSFLLNLASLLAGLWLWQLLF
jgi:hypothetical protein